MSSNNAPPFSGEDSTLSNSFKRSYDQIDVDIECGDAHARVSTPSSSGSRRTPERHKRARSETRSDDELGIAGAGGGSLPLSETMSRSAIQMPPSTPAGPSRLSSSESVVPGPAERFNLFDAQMAVLRQDPPLLQDQASDNNSGCGLTGIRTGQMGVSDSLNVGHIATRSPSPHSGGPQTYSREVFVISDSEDDVQIVEQPARRTIIETAPAPLQDFPELANPWVDAVDSRVTADRAPRGHPQSFRHVDHPPSTTLTVPDSAHRHSASQAALSCPPSGPPVRTSSRWNPDSSVYRTPFVDDSWAPPTVTGSERRTPWTHRRSPSSSPEPSATLGRAERDQAIRQLRAQRRSLFGVFPRESVSSSSSTPSVPATYFAAAARGHLPASPRPSPASSTSRSDRLRPISLSSLRAPSGTHVPQLGRTPSEQRRFSLVMESMLDNNPEMIRHTRSARRRAFAATRAASVERDSQTSSTLTSARNFEIAAPGRSHTSGSRPAPPSVSNRSLDNTALSASSMSSSGQSAHIAAGLLTESVNSSSMPAAVASPTRSANTSAVASPLRHAFPAGLGSGSTTSSDARTGSGANLRDVVLQVENLSAALAQVVAASNTSHGVRDAALRVINSGRVLVRAVNSQDTALPVGGASFARNTPSNTGISSDTLDLADPPGAPVSVIPSEESGLEARLRELTEETAHLRESAALHDLVSQRYRTRSPSLTPSLVSGSSTPSQRPLPAPFRTWNTSGPMYENATRIEREDTQPDFSSDRSSSRATPDRMASSQNDNSTNSYRLLAERLARAENPGADRWTQARQRRRELTNALVAETELIQRAYDLHSRSIPNVQADARMVDSEEEVEYLFDAGGTQESTISQPERARQIDPGDTPEAVDTSSATLTRNPFDTFPSQETSERRMEARDALPAPHQVINLEAYHRGPFRGALARVVEASRRQQRLNDSSSTPLALGRRREGSISRPADTFSQPPTPAREPRQRISSRLARSANGLWRNHAPSVSDELIMGGLLSEWEDELADFGEHRLDLAPSTASRRASQATSSFRDHPAISQQPTAHGSDSGARSGDRAAANDTFASPNYSSRRRALQLFDRLSEPRSLSQSLNPPESPYRRAWRSGLSDLEDRFLFQTFGRHDPRGVSDSVVSALPTGTYAEWAVPGETEDQCPICFDDYSAADPVLKLPKCKHWFHKPCIEKWFKTATTCPICRESVETRASGRTSVFGPRPGRPVPNPADAVSSTARADPFGRSAASAAVRAGSAASATPRRFPWMIRDPWHDTDALPGPSELFDDLGLWSSGYDFPDPLLPGRAARANRNAGAHGSTTEGQVNRAQEQGRGQVQTLEQSNGVSPNASSRPPHRDMSENFWDFDDDLFPW